VIAFERWRKNKLPYKIKRLFATFWPAQKVEEKN
jgi:hypothetical protein